MPRDPASVVAETANKYGITIPLLQKTLAQYDSIVIQDSEQLRNYITNKLIEISSCGSTKEELKALELLGKISDVSLFSEKTEIKITHTDSASLESTIKDKISKLLAAKQQSEEIIEDAEYIEESENEEFDEEPSEND